MNVSFRYQQILCVCCSEYNEWDRENVVMTGSADGVVRMWSIDYVEVPVGADREQDEQVSFIFGTEFTKQNTLLESPNG